ncbi:hypothetical protein [Actinotalea subterranea]|uniref:hypothetical protein n=1 Tax=Actinotalea subterranea TaxID=2607497 RepID=UPI0011ECE1E3|nr:hypothetical protein [Actinotalea subterranea]
MASPSSARLVRQLQSASSPREAERSRWILEAAFLPNQVLRAGAEEVARLVAHGLATASPAGRGESWELLSQLAAGSAGRTAADEEVVRGVRLALREAVGAALERASSASPEADDFLAVDVLDSLLSTSDEPLRARCIAALRKFAERGPRELLRVTAVLGDPAT